MKFLEYAIFADVILSWIQPGKVNKLTEIVHIFTDPLLKPARKIQAKFLPQVPLDFSALIALLMIQFLESLVGYYMYSLVF